MLIRREIPADVDAVRAVTAAAFATEENAPEPFEAPLLDALRADPGWIPGLSLVATDAVGDVIGHVVCTRGLVAATVPALGLGPLSVHPDHRGRGAGTALVHTALGAADARAEPLVAALGDPDWYGRFGFTTATEYAITPPDPAWTAAFQVRPLSAYTPSCAGPFTCPRPLMSL
ncbi:GNAT family N-acetyltransferase [Streptomyces radicis]|uniref:N-acetyltransferase n=1 Tax=Streptomyces radicis TaxID=1750517 RepID=A0A3A9WFN5_9ACTN|nr:N-acetyltransferase [Streptomyces radicis]RKN11412.1 N-acetyltransferase [Streptomyces radicis]RKN26569.1 N-acetyltransferase [Streptomyces radicis]